MSNTICFEDIGCDALNLMETDASGNISYFVRKICKDSAGNYTIENINLDGSPKTIGTESVVTPVMDGCAASVTSMEYWDLNPGPGLAEPGVKKCARPFLRHFVYDCSGKVASFYDTTRTGLAYSAAEPVECSGGLLPSVTELEWPPAGFEIDPADGGLNKNFIYHVQNPKTHEILDMKFFTATARSTTECYNPTQTSVAVNAPISAAGPAFRTGNAWKNKPSENSLFRFTFSASAAEKMSALRLDFIDLDSFEGVWGLRPWPDAFAVYKGGVALSVEDTLVFDISKGAFKPIDGNNDNNVYAYYYDVPLEIEHYYHNAGGGIACHAARFTAFTYEPGPCCNCCEEDNNGNGNGNGDCENWTTTHIVREDINFTHDFDFITMGTTSAAPYSGNFQSGNFFPGVVWDVDSGQRGGPSGSYSDGYKMLSNAEPLCIWKFSEPVNLEFGLSKFTYGYGRMAFTNNARLLSFRDDKCEWDSVAGILDVFSSNHAPLTDRNPYARFQLDNVSEIIFQFLDASGTATGLHFELMYLKATTLRDRLGFMRAFTYDCNNQLISTKDFGVNGTPYTPVGSTIF